ncbi:MAG: membrane dipeptidase [Acidilobaceae archaeon]
MVYIIDLHEDISTYFMLHGGGYKLADFNIDIDNRDADIPKYIRGGVKLVFASIFTGLESFEPEVSSSYERIYGVWVPAIIFRGSDSILFEQLRIYHRLVEYYRELILVDSYSSIEDVFRSQGRVGLLLHLEGAEPIADPYDLKLLHKLGLRSLGLTWNPCNKYGCGASAKRDYGLTDEGVELIEMANKLGIIVDLAHASKKTALDALSIAKKPVLISHANLRRFVDTPRNVDDEILEALSRNKGVIGLSCIGPLITKGGRPELRDLLDQYIYIYEVYGPDIIGIGTDFLGLLGLPTPRGFESIDKVQELIKQLRERGLSDSDIEKIAYKNALRVIRENIED